jgi:hypothetical protein
MEQYGKCGSAGDGQRSPYHWDCINPNGHDGPHEDFVGRQWWTNKHAQATWEAQTTPKKED